MTKAVRKEISKGDYKFFIGRVEKIGNGQVEFNADTQKKAVELLGEKIPQNIFVTENTETIYLANTGAYTYKLENGEGLDDYYFKQKLHAAIKNGAKIKIRNGLTLYGWIEFSPMEMSDVEICDANRMTELGDCTDKRIAAIIEYPTNAQEEVEEVIDYLDDYAVSVEAQEAAINATENALDN